MKLSDSKIKENLSLEKSLIEKGWVKQENGTFWIEGYIIN